MARKGTIRGNLQYAIIFMFISLSSIIYLISYFTLPSGTATYITGLPFYLFFFVIIITEFLFDQQISTISGAIAGVEYLIIYLLASKHLATIQCPDKLMLQDITDFPIYFFKSIMMLFTGIIIGVLSHNTKGLILKILDEENKRKTIDRLFGQYVSEEIKNKIISEKKDIEGEKRNVVILFSDIRSFSTISEKLPPEIIVKQLNKYLDKMVACINSDGGVIDKLVGNAIMATFGGILKLENEAESALKTSQQMLKELETLNEKWKKYGLPEFKIGIGIH